MQTSPPLSPARVLVGALLRALVLAVVAYAAFRLVALTSGPTVGANIGAGIAGLLAGPLVALVWGFVDGRRARWSALWPWAVACLLAGVAAAVREGDASAVTAFGVVPMLAAAIGVALGAAFGGPQRSTRSG